MSNAVADFLAGSSRYPAVVFGEVGHAIVGKIVETPRVLTTQGDKGPETKLLISLEVEAGSTAGWREKLTKRFHPATPGEVMTLWVKQGFQSQALAEALEAAGSQTVDVGARLAFVLTEYRDTGKPQPAGVYAAQYAPPVQGTAIPASLLGGAPQTPAPAPAAAPAPVAQPTPAPSLLGATAPAPAAPAAPAGGAPSLL